MAQSPYTYVGSDESNFSYKTVGFQLIIPSDQQMFVFQNITINEDGDLVIDGELVLVDG